MAMEPSLSVLDLIGDGVFHIFQVEDTLFKLPTQHFCQHVRFFATLLSLPGSKTSTNEDPIHIYDTTVDTFVFVLEWLYRLPPSQSLDKEGWIKIFRFAQAYHMDELQKETLDKLNTFKWNPIEQLNFCERYSVAHSWAASSLAILASRWAPLSDVEENAIEPRTFGLVMKLREVARERSWPRTCSIFSYPPFPPVLKFTSADVVSYVGKWEKRRSVSWRNEPSRRMQSDEWSLESSTVEAPQDETKVGTPHERFYLSDELVHCSNDTATLHVHAGVLAIHSPTLADMASNTLQQSLLSTVAFRCIRWIYRETALSKSSKEEWIDILRFSHTASIPLLKTHAAAALAEPVPLDALQRIRLCEECCVPLEWAEKAIQSIAIQEDALEFRNFEGLSGPMMLFLMKHREQAIMERLHEEKAKNEQLKGDFEKEKAELKKQVTQLEKNRGSAFRY
ncbi:hypothetical protein DL96DRAFT_1615318 [Flagelloscypha sp. PMI_526]|nr:hypothetical protein DL96DRAFT_1615318 [Flagelloscypha sp. PMI_526]